MYNEKRYKNLSLDRIRINNIFLYCICNKLVVNVVINELYIV